MLFLSQEELDTLYDDYQEGKAIYRANYRPCWDNLNGEEGIVKWQIGYSVYKGKRREYIPGHYVFYPKNKEKHGNNVFVVREENLEWKNFR